MERLIAQMRETLPALLQHVPLSALADHPYAQNYLSDNVIVLLKSLDVPVSKLTPEHLKKIFACAAKEYKAVVRSNVDGVLALSNDLDNGTVVVDLRYTKCPICKQVAVTDNICLSCDTFFGV